MCILLVSHSSLSRTSLSTTRLDIDCIQVVVLLVVTSYMPMSTTAGCVHFIIFIFMLLIDYQFDFFKSRIVMMMGILTEVQIYHTTHNQPHNLDVDLDLSVLKSLCGFQ